LGGRLVVPPKVRPDIFGVITKVCPISGFGKGIGIPVWTKHVIPFVVGNVRIHAYVTGVKSGTGPIPFGTSGDTTYLYLESLLCEPSEKDQVNH
jgi:hypothetical protein